MINWPKPTTLKALRGFLGLTGYYRRFVKGYGVLSRPLTELLKKGNFKWGEEAEGAFQKLKEAMVTVPTLGLPDFNEPFTLETDACGVGMGAVLLQKGRPLAFLSQALNTRHLGLSIYEKEFLAVLMAVEKWRHYLEGSRFIIKTDHESLKFLLQQKLHTQLQKRGMAKLMGLDYSIQYRRGKENVVADALSRRQEEGSTSAITAIIPAWCQEVIDSYDGDEQVKRTLEEVVVSPRGSMTTP